MSNERTRNYASVVYPESAPEGWQTVLADQLVPALISPLHDRDLNELGEYKKPHFHVMLLFSSVKTKDQAAEIFRLVGGVGCVKVNCVRAYARYLVHADHPDKAQYDRKDVVAMCGVDYDSLVSLPEDRYNLIGEIVNFCCENDMVSFSDLMEYCRVENWPWFRIVCDNALTLREYLRSKAWTNSVKDKQPYVKG